MRRNNMIQQFIGEPDPLSDGTAVEGVGYDAIEIDIKRGRITLVVPAGTPDDSVWDAPRTYMLEIETEEGQTLQFEIDHGICEPVVI